MLRSKTHEKETDQVEEWYGTKYKVEDFSEALKQKIVNPSINDMKKQLDLPPKNNLIPTNFDILSRNERLSEQTKLLKQWDDTDLWYKKDDTFNRPKSVVSCKLYTKDCHMGKTVKARVFVHLWTQMQNEYLREFNYMANCANLSFNVTPMQDNLNMTWSGFNDSMPTYIKESIEKMLSLKDVNDSELEEIFNQVKEKLLVDWKNFYFEQSY